MNDPIPAVAEAAAIGPIAEIFADIRLVLGVEVVNLIWRHLATITGALPWAWGMLRPLYADGTIAAEREVLHSQLALPVLPPFPPEVLTAAGLADEDIASVGNILAAYDRTNAMALVALLALLQRLDGRPSRRDQLASGSAQRGPRGPLPIPLPPLPAVSELPEPVGNLVLALNRLGTRREEPILASMYRHLAYWPAYLALSWTLIAPLHANGTLERAIARLLEKAEGQAAGLAARLQEPPLDAVTGSAIRSAVAPFAGDVIAKMVVICALLRRVTQPQTQSD